MTQAEFEAACGRTLALLKTKRGPFDSRRNTEYPTSPEHLGWMLVQAVLFHVEGGVDNANRWLGFVQGVLVTLRDASLDEVKRANMPDGETSGPEKGP